MFMLTEERIQYQDDFFLRKAFRRLKNFGISCPTSPQKDPREAFCTKRRNAKLGLDQGWALGHKRESTFFSSKTFIFFFFSVCRSASKECHLERSENKATNKGNSSIFFLRKSFDCVLNIDPCLSCSTS